MQPKIIGQKEESLLRDGSKTNKEEEEVMTLCKEKVQ